MSKRMYLFRELTLGAKFRFCDKDSVYVKVSPGQYAEITTNSRSCILSAVNNNNSEKELELVMTNFYCDRTGDVND